MSRASTILTKRPTPDFPTNLWKSDGKCPHPRDLRHLQCCQFAVKFAKLSLHVEVQSIRGWIVPKLSEYVKVAEAAEILGVSPGTVRTWAADNKIPMHRNPANGYRLFRRDELESFLRIVEASRNIGKPKSK